MKATVFFFAFVISLGAGVLGADGFNETAACGEPAMTSAAQPPVLGASLQTAAVNCCDLAEMECEAQCDLRPLICGVLQFTCDQRTCISRCRCRPCL